MTWTDSKMKQQKDTETIYWPEDLGITVPELVFVI